MAVSLRLILLGALCASGVVLAQPGQNDVPLTTPPGLADVVPYDPMDVPPPVPAAPGTVATPGVVGSPGTVATPGSVATPGPVATPGTVTTPGVVASPGTVATPGVMTTPALVAPSAQMVIAPPPPAAVVAAPVGPPMVATPGLAPPTGQLPPPVTDAVPSSGPVIPDDDMAGAPGMPPPPPGAPTVQRQITVETLPVSPPPPGAPPPPLPNGTPATSVGGHLREGAFLSSPGSLTFLIHHTLMGAAGGFVTQAIPNNFVFDKRTRDFTTVGTAIGAGLGFASSTWYQFNHFVGMPAESFSIANSLFGGMMFGGIGSLISKNPIFTAWSAFIGAELGSWLTVALSAGELQVSDGVFMTSASVWVDVLSALVLAMIGNSGHQLTGAGIAGTLLIGPGIGTIVAAIAATKWHPSTPQILRADALGAGVGAAVLIITGLLMGFNTVTPYALAFGTALATVSLVSVFWDEGAERSVSLPFSGAVLEQRYTGIW